MTTDDKHGIPDDEFEAFLKGEDELSRRLKALPQPSPAAEQDAAILKRVRFAMAQEARPVAANDAGHAFNRRWRVPVGIAATLLAGVLAHQAWQENDVDRAGRTLPEQAPAARPGPRQTAPAAPSAFQQTAPAAEPQREAPAAAPAAKAAPDGTRARGALVVPPAPAAVASPPAPAPAAAAPSPQAPASLAEAVPSPPPAQGPASLARAAPPPVAAAPLPPLMYAPPQQAVRAGAASHADTSTAVSVTGSRVRVETQKFGAAAPSAPAAWLDLIDEMLKAGLPRDAQGEWNKFRQAYPDYPVPEPLAARIRAIQK